MKILLLSATEMEIQPTLNAGGATGTLIAGVGVPATVYGLMDRLRNNKYDLIIQAGIGGTFTNSVRLGETVIIEHDCFADLAIEENGNLKTVFDMGFADRDQFPFTNGWLVNGSPVLKTLSLPRCKGITVNKITDEQRQLELLKNKYGAAVESMEGAALHYVCLQQHIPFLQLRGISNHVGERDKTKWELREAVQSLNLNLQQIIKDLT